MDSGGREALLHSLESCDLAAVDLRAIAKTGALLDRKMPSLPAERGGGLRYWSAANCRRGGARCRRQAWRLAGRCEPYLATT